MFIMKGKTQRKGNLLEGSIREKEVIVKRATQYANSLCTAHLAYHQAEFCV